MPWSDAGKIAPVTGVRDGFVWYVSTRVRARDPARAQRLLHALSRVRAAAAAQRPLSFDLLADWHRDVLGVRGTFRAGVAFAKQGRERYGHYDGIEADFDQCLAQSDTAASPLAARAARAYLDVCFFHPFDDGNARAAMLTAYHVLMREHVALDQAEPLLTVARYADDLHGALALAHLIHVLAAATRQRSKASVWGTTPTPHQPAAPNGVRIGSSRGVS